MRVRNALAALVALIPFAARAQVAPRWRNVDIARQLRDSLPQRIRVQYSAGKVDVRSTVDPLLYSMHLRYDETRMAPLHRHDAEQRSTVLGLEASGGASTHLSPGEGELRLMLPRTIPLELDLELGTTESTMDLGGMSIHSLRLECGGADASLRFSQLNRVRMRTLDVDIGGADFIARELGNANADQIRLRGGVGAFDLDFSGVWSHDVTVTSRVSVGGLTIRVPADIGVRVEVQRFATGFSHSGLVKRDDAWYSPNFETARYKLRLRAENIVGRIEVKGTQE